MNRVKSVAYGKLKSKAKRSGNPTVLSKKFGSSRLNVVGFSNAIKISHTDNVDSKASSSCLINCFSHKVYNSVIREIESKLGYICSWYSEVYKFEFFSEEVNPETMDISKMSKERLVKFIKQGERFKKNNRIYIDTNGIKGVEFVDRKNFIDKKKKVRKSISYKVDGLEPIFKSPLDIHEICSNPEGKQKFIKEILSENLEVINLSIKINQIKYIYNFELRVIHLTPELSAIIIYVKGCN